MIRATSAALVTLLLCACGGSPADGNSEMVGNMAPPALGPDGKPFKVEVVGEFAEPFALTFLADGRALVTEKGGKLKLWQSGRPLIDIAGAPLSRLRRARARARFVPPGRVSEKVR